MEISKERLIGIMNGFNDRSVAVVGDLCLDEYIYGTANSLSPEAPIPRVVIDSKKYAPGTAGNIGCCTRALGAKTSVYGIVGSDTSGRIILDELGRKGINTSGIITVSNRNTPTYSRVIAGSQQLVRFDLENKTEADEGIVAKVFKNLEMAIKDSDAVIFADYDEVGHGLVRPNLLDNLAHLASEYHKILVGISRKRINQLRNFSLVVPNQREAGNEVGLEIKTQDDVEKAGKMLIQKLNSNIAITKGEYGVSIFNREGRSIHHIPSLAQNVVDVTGAGDTFTSAATLALASGATLQEAAYLGSYAAGIAVGKEGTASVTIEEIKKRIYEK